MSSSELPPLPPLYSLPPLQQPPSLYGGSSAKVGENFYFNYSIPYNLY